MNCEARVALVTGAAGGGMGRSIALTLAREGARVMVNYLASEEMAGRVVGHVTDRGGEAIAVRADVFTAEGCKELVDAALDKFGRIDILIVGPGGGWHPEPPEKLPAEDALDDVRRELAPLYYLMPLVLPGMYEREWGRVIALGVASPYSTPAYAYNVGKAARAHAMFLAHAEAWKHGVTFNSIGPGPVPAIESFKAAVELCDQGPAWDARGTATPQDIAEGVAFLCSEAGRFISGTELAYQWREV